MTILDCKNVSFISYYLWDDSQLGVKYIYDKEFCYIFRMKGDFTVSLLEL